MKYTPAQAYERLADLCARAEYSTGELREKLRRMAMAPTDADAIVARLQRERYVDDARFAAAFVRQKATLSRWGRRKIAAALYSKRVARDIAERALDEIPDEVYAEALCGLLRSKAATQGSDALATYEGRTRLFRFAASRGFLTTEITAALRRLLEETKS